ncbi:carbamoyltransferase HypF [Shewanella marinintestina]|uniref:carbamoyltransferase HypF n=1 Tax=Shewanella marinintestina TaxID=190305 RepID=UPI00200D3DA0|nr:carbamoyltransferase HypF [Shewanella marinintestina]MCL1144547.1 carbamoyltransferase HypF [Shewanella marinintestina]
MTLNNLVMRQRIKITGIVQGVGFRPFVYRLATEHQLYGNVLNNSEGVTIEVQGNQASLNAFINNLEHTPPLARIDNLHIQTIETEHNCHQFNIIHSETNAKAHVAVSSDKSTCEDCFKEINDPHNRHYRYPFTNCTNCGPRYTLINALPYDRKNTTMASFTMCDDCSAAYSDPTDRRYHAQPVSCPNCGPQLSFKTPTLAVIKNNNDALTQAVKQLKAGKILAIKGLGGYHLVCDATNTDTIAILRQRKARPAKPFAVMVATSDIAAELVSGNKTEWQTLASAERPIVLMQKLSASQPLSNASQTCSIGSLSPLVAPDIDRLGVFLPYTPLHQLLLDALARPLVMTSANLSGEPIIINSEEISSKLGHVVDYILDHDRIILNSCDDSVVQVINDKVQVLRLARGYAPLSIHTPNPIKQQTLAIGAQQKNSLCFGVENNLFLSPYIGDIVSVEAEDYFHKTLATFTRLYRFSSQHIVHDLHPDYITSQWAAEQAESQTARTIRLTSVQHHYAHILSVMAANQMTTPVLGFSFDGTGLGDDNTLWGGEVILCDVHDYQRLVHIKPFQLIGGEQAIKQPYRVLLSLLLEKYSKQELSRLQLTPLTNINPNVLNNLTAIWSKNSSIKCSSVGRLFDAVAVLLGLVTDLQYEGQAGILIETAANRVVDKNDINFYHSKNSTANDINYAGDKLSMTLHWQQKDSVWDASDLIAQLVDHVVAEPLTEIRIALLAKAFMDAIANMVCDCARQLNPLHWPQPPTEQELQNQTPYPIVLSGGVFQNRYLLSLCENKLKQLGYEVLNSHNVPINDGGIALGQLWFGIHNPPTPTQSAFT